MYTKKSGFIVAVKAFHGKTMGALSLIGKKDYREPVGQLYWWPVYHVPYGDADAVERQLEICEEIGVGIAAVMMEPIQGEAWAIVPPDDFWPRIRKATKNMVFFLLRMRFKQVLDVQESFGELIIGELFQILWLWEKLSVDESCQYQLLFQLKNLADHDAP